VRRACKHLQAVETDIIYQDQHKWHPESRRPSFGVLGQSLISLQFLDENADTEMTVDGEQGNLAALAKVKGQNIGLKTLISIGGSSGSAEFSEMAASDDARKVFSLQLRTSVDKYEFNGIDSESTPLDSTEHVACR
jgi:GH18 family chitinase